MPILIGLESRKRSSKSIDTSELTEIPELQIHPESAKKGTSSLYLETSVCGMLLAFVVRLD